MELWNVVHVTCLLLGCLLCLVLGKLLLKYYSTILFVDRNIFTYLNTAAVISIEIIVNLWVSQMIDMLQTIICVRLGPHGCAPYGHHDPPGRGSDSQGVLLARYRIRFLHRLMQHCIQNALHFQGEQT
jgi:hypothetical protein